MGSFPVQSYGSAPHTIPTPQPSGGVSRNLALGCLALLFGGITMGAIAFVTSKLLAKTREPVAQQAPVATTLAPTNAPTYAAGNPTPTTGGKPAPTEGDDMPGAIVIDSNGGVQMAGGDGMPALVVAGPAQGPAEPMPPRGAHVFVEEPTIVSQDVPSGLVRTVLAESQADFDSCRTDQPTRVMSQVFFGFGRITMAQAAYDNPGNRSVANCIAHRFQEHMGDRCTDCDGIITLWSNVPAR